MPKTKPRIQKRNPLHQKNGNSSKLSILEIREREQEIETCEKENEIFQQTIKLAQIKAELPILSKDIDNARRKLQHKKEKLKLIELHTNNVSKQIQNSKHRHKEKTAFSISNLTACKRKLKPSVDDLPSRPKALEGKKHSKPVKPFMVAKKITTLLYCLVWLKLYQLNSKVMLLLMLF